MSERLISHKLDNKDERVSVGKKVAAMSLGLTALVGLGGCSAEAPSTEEMVSITTELEGRGFSEVQWDDGIDSLTVKVGDNCRFPVREGVGYNNNDWVVDLPSSNPRNANVALLKEEDSLAGCFDK